MKIKTKIKLLTILIAVLACALIAGCQVGRETYGQYVERNGLSSHITYYANGGLFETRQDKKEIYYKPDTYAVNIGVTDLGNSTVSVHRDGYVLKAWCAPVLDARGEIVYEDDAKTIVKTGEEFDFSKKLKDGDEITLYATWTLDVQIEIRLAGTDSVTIKDGENTKTVNKGEELLHRTFGRDTQIFIADTAPVESTDSTFLQYFTDSNCTIPFNGIAVKPSGENAPNLVIYAKYMPGIYTVVKDSGDALDMFMHMGGTTKFYIYNDIDMNGEKIPEIYATGCTIEGNGNVKISNFAVEITRLSTGRHSLFGTFYFDAVIKNVTFDSVTVSYQVVPGNSANNPNIVFLYAVCNNIEDGASFENVVVSNIKVNITMGENVQITNMYSENAGYATDNWLFGKEVGQDESYSDAQFMQEYGGLTVNGASLTINGEIIASAD